MNRWMNHCGPPIGTVIALELRCDAQSRSRGSDPNCKTVETVAILAHPVEISEHVLDTRKKVSRELGYGSTSQAAVSA